MERDSLIEENANLQFSDTTAKKNLEASPTWTGITKQLGELEETSLSFKRRSVEVDNIGKFTSALFTSYSGVNIP